MHSDVVPTLAEQIMDELRERPMNIDALSYELGCERWAAWCAVAALCRRGIAKPMGNRYDRETLYTIVRRPP